MKAMTSIVRLVRPTMALVLLVAVAVPTAAAQPTSDQADREAASRIARDANESFRVSKIGKYTAEVAIASGLVGGWVTLLASPTVFPGVGVAILLGSLVVAAGTTIGSKAYSQWIWNGAVREYSSLQAKVGSARMTELMFEAFGREYDVRHALEKSGSGVSRNGATRPGTSTRLADPIGAGTSR